ncbi:unnamed protein product, partial [Iphiclides podalirius]
MRREHLPSGRSREAIFAKYKRGMRWGRGAHHPRAVARTLNRAAGVQIPRDGRRAGHRAGAGEGADREVASCDRSR